MQERLITRALELLESGEVARVIGWKRGELGYDTTPAVFETAEELKAEFVYGDFCGANLSKYLIKNMKNEGKTLVFLKLCDTYSFNQLLTEHRIKREKTYVIAVGCAGMADPERLRGLGITGITGIASDGDTYKIDTVYGEKTVSQKDALCIKCLSCKGGEPVVADEVIDGELTPPEASDRFEQVRAIEAMTPEERFDFWRGELSRCIRCNACRNVCPACSCESCVFDNPDSGIAQKAAVSSFEENNFHIIRAFHVAGRCTDCGECSRVCPENIPLHLLNRKFIADIDHYYGEYQAGEAEGQRAPLVDYTEEDAEPSAIYDR
ncbi:MAG: 4Fe-4S dicluster domain-containing protein [Clostridia bacterium]|nr:4Fe-4S dicluster domain-containing protein [Clostridia bacterium]